MDLSEQCGYSVTDQIKLFNSIKPLFANKLVFVVINKIDVKRPEDLEPEMQAELQSILKSGEVEMLQLSCTTTEGVTAVKNAACDKLVAERVAQKLKAGSNNSGTPSGRLGDVLSRIHVAMPMGGVTRETYIPEAVKSLKKYDKEDPERRKLERDIEEENGGAGVYNIDLHKNYMLANDEWKQDKMPEIWNGKNVYDFVDPDIEAKLAALEEEEEKLEADGFYESDESVEDAEDADIRVKADLIREKRALIRNEAKQRKSLKNRAVIPRSAKAKKLSEMEAALDSVGYDAGAATARAREQSQAPRGRTTTRSEIDNDDAMDIDASSNPREAIARAKSRARSQAATNRLLDGVQDATSRSKAERLAKLGQKKMNRMARQGEADRHTTASLPKHLVCSHLLSDRVDTDVLTVTLVHWQAYHWQDAASLDFRPGGVVDDTMKSGRAMIGIKNGVLGSLIVSYGFLIANGRLKSRVSIVDVDTCSYRYTLVNAMAGADKILNTPFPSLRNIRHLTPYGGSD